MSSWELSQTQASQFSMFRYGLLSSSGRAERRAEGFQALQSITRVLWTWIDQQWYSKDFGASSLNGHRALVRGERNDGKGFERTAGMQPCLPQVQQHALRTLGVPQAFLSKLPVKNS